MGESRASRPYRGRTKNSPLTANTLVQTSDALELRLAHMTFKQIAEHLGIPLTTVHGQVSKALSDLRKNIYENAEELRTLMLVQLDELHRVWWPLATGDGKGVIGDDGVEKIPPPDRGALDRILRIMDRKMALLGLVDAPPEPDVGVAAQAMREKAKAYEGMGVAELSRFFAEKIKAPVVLQGEARLIDARPVPQADV